MMQGVFRQKSGFVDHRRQTSLIIGYHDVSAERVDLGRTSANGALVQPIDERTGDFRGAGGGSRRQQIPERTPASIVP
ncbi:hypothetical protein, partial [Burkholderia arboris]|uniref:hypothetical protein n=1 Tax=Burkholderia arboris TaxID=488730 RepID=UPI001C2E1006